MGNTAEITCCTKPNTFNLYEKTIDEVFNNLEIKNIDGQLLYMEFKNYHTKFNKQSNTSKNLNKKFDDLNYEIEQLNIKNNLSDDSLDYNKPNFESTDDSAMNVSSVFQNHNDKNLYINKLLNAKEKNHGGNDYFEFHFKYLSYLIDQPADKFTRQFGIFIIQNSKFPSDKVKINFLLSHICEFYGKEDNDFLELLKDVVEINTSVVLKSFESLFENSDIISEYENTLWSSKNKIKLIESLFALYKNFSKDLNFHDSTISIPQGIENNNDKSILSSEWKKSKSKGKKLSLDIDIIKTINIKENNKKVDVKNLKKRFDEDKELAIRSFLVQHYEVLNGSKIRNFLSKLIN